jgi:hypothetical protein
MSGRYFSSYDGKTVMADVDVNGNSLELTIEDEKVKAIGNIPVGGGDDSVWTSETSNALADDEGDDILDEEGNVIGDENAETLWVTRNGIEFKAKRAEADINGNSLALTIDSESDTVTHIGGKGISGLAPLPTPQDDDVILAGTATGNKVWQPLAKDTFGSITDDEGDDIQDEEGNSIGDENSVELWTSFNGTGFGAERAVADADGNNIAETYAKKGEASSVTTSYDAQTKTLTINI